MSDYIDYVVADVKPLGEDLAEEGFYLDTRWLEVRDDDNFQEAILHIFKEEGEYLHSINGNITKGVWKTLDGSNTLILEHGSRHELYDLTFMNQNFFILRKHGNQAKIGQKKYLVLGREGYVRGLEWKDYIELLYNEYRQNFRFRFFVAVTVVFIAVILLFVLI